jgi:hypothetical protein
MGTAVYTAVPRYLVGSCRVLVLEYRYERTRVASGYVPGYSLNLVLLFIPDMYYGYSCTLSTKFSTKLSTSREVDLRRGTIVHDLN